MAEETKTLNVFVAMPGTDFGAHAHWSNPEQVRRFYQHAAEALEESLGCKVRLLVEKERHRGGVIHDTMYREAFEADVYLADLTGANPNVFLELGVRFALRRGVTVLLAQDTTKVPFNVEPLRVIQYADRLPEDSLKLLVEFVRAGLADPDHCDSPVMKALDLKVVGSGQWNKVAGERVRRLLDAMSREKDVERRLTLLRQAVEEDPWSVEARFRHVVELRELGRLEDARQEAEKGLSAAPRYAPFHQQLGLVLGQLGRREESVAALRQAVELDPQNPDLLAGLGGALRRLALSGGLQQRDHALLEEAAAHYEAALSLNRHDTYPALNIVRLCLLISDRKPDAADRAEALLDRLRHLCAFEVVEAPRDYWRRFDLADTHLFRGEALEGLEAYRQGIDLVPAVRRTAVLEAPLSTLNELVAGQVLSEKAEPGVRGAVDLLEAAAKRGPHA